MDASGLIALKAYLSDPAHWTQIEAGRDADGKPCDVKSAVAVCLIGGCEKFAIADHERFQLARLVPGDLIGLWNDNPKRTHKEVIDLLTTAIAKVEKAKERKPREQ